MIMNVLCKKKITLKKMSLIYSQRTAERCYKQFRRLPLCEFDQKID